MPTAWQALADPDGSHLWPLMPDAVGPGDPPLQAWFTPAVHLLAYSVSWPSLGLGAARWISLTSATVDRRLRLVEEMVGDRLDELLAWLVTSDWPVSLASAVASAAGAEPHAPSVAVDANWLQRVERATNGWSPYGGGSDPMHLAVHSMAPAEEPKVDGLMAQGDGRSVLLVVDEYAGWYSALCRQGGALPPRTDGRSWRVDVVCRPIGWLGNFRRSRVTGRWFAGGHAVHMMGWSDG